MRENGDGEREEEEDMVIAGPPVGAAAMAAAAEDGYLGRVMSLCFAVTGDGGNTERLGFWTRAVGHSGPACSG